MKMHATDARLHLDSESIEGINHRTDNASVRVRKALGNLFHVLLNHKSTLNH
jgi:hypothetical protein